MNIELEKSKSHILIEIIEYVPNSVVTKTIIRKTTGNVSIVAIDIGEALAEKISALLSSLQLKVINILQNRSLYSSSN